MRGKLFVLALVCALLFSFPARGEGPWRMRVIARGNSRLAQAEKLADKICGLRVFADEAGKMNLNLETVGGSLLVVSQFTLYADIKSRRPGFTKAAKPDVAIPLYEKFMDLCRSRGFQVEHGQFGADMAVSSVNDGPVTIWMDTAEM